MERTANRSTNLVNGSEPAWYCLRSQPKHEHIAAAHLRMLESVKVYCPRIRFKKRTRQGLVWVTEAMFPGYLFARLNLAEMHRRVAHTHGVSSIVRFADRYPTIEEEVLLDLQEHAGRAEVTEVAYEVSQGDDVNIVEGAFNGLEVVVTRIMPGKQRVMVLMDFLGRKIEAEVDRSSVLPKLAHPLAA